MNSLYNNLFAQVRILHYLQSSCNNRTFLQIKIVQYTNKQTNKQTNNNDLLEKDGGTKNCI